MKIPTFYSFFKTTASQKTFHIQPKTELSSKVGLMDDYYPICAWEQEEPGAVQLGGSKYFNHHSDIPLTRVKSKHNLNC